MANAGNPQNTATPVATGAQGPNVFNQSAGAYGNALDAAGKPLYTGSIANTDLSQYTNPYETQVVNNTMNDKCIWW